MCKGTESKTDRLKTLTEIVQKAAKGEHEGQADLPEYDDELEPLARAFNDLIDRMREKTSALETTEQTRQNTLDNYQRLESIIPGMVYVFALHPDGTYSLPYVSPACCEQFGLEPEEVMGSWDLVYNLVPFVVLRVNDNGVGMDDETMSHIFEPFFTTKDLGKGTGLGLATVYGIVKQNNGFIHVLSQPGQGTTFEVYLPRLAKEDNGIEDVLRKTPETYDTCTVLLVEDNPMVRDTTAVLLERAGHKVLAVATPEEALKLCQEISPQIDLLLTDVVMPGMSGKELKDRLEAIRPGICTIFMSGYPADIIAPHGVLAPGMHFIQKPFKTQELQEKVREAMRKTGK